MHIEINGQTRDMPADTTVAGLLESLGFKSAGTVVERNGRIVEQAAFARTILSQDDRLEIVRLVGGG